MVLWIELSTLIRIVHYLWLVAWLYGAKIVVIASILEAGIVSWIVFHSRVRSGAFRALSARLISVEVLLLINLLSVGRFDHINTLLTRVQS